MKIFFQRSGGIAGMVIEASLDTASLGAEKSGELLRLVESANALSLPEKLSGPAGSADDFEYQLVIDDGKKKHSVVFDGRAMPAELKPLVRWLTAAAAPKKSA